MSQTSMELPPTGGFVVNLEGFEGPLDLLLNLARDQKLDLARISILQLADQYIAYIQEARRLRLEVAADYLVMAAWLAYLKSRLLLPPDPSDERPSAPEMAEALAFQLRRLEAMRSAAEQLWQRPQLGIAIFPRGIRQEIKQTTRHIHQVGIFDLLDAYAQHQRRQQQLDVYRAEMPYPLISVEEAIERLSRLLGSMPEWKSLAEYLPALDNPLARRSALAANFGATLELAKRGVVELRQEQAFAPIYLRSRSSEGE